ncbi:NAD-dependent epimerase/dehydratase family protein [Stenotrophobium rhamnosiphilum]|uniref:Epimerase n=1 Tax=Stenotrophobium rhamnosiphilum TaxID=2029166 RepID=A0A2T5MGP3_9GAMM|nr:NAD-dependent epimerase/dehydratase family protein [Stenotrophobium rhamnosiphilum]PTU31730.1 epimerase [Stenotrophobium rhamnosiphilum]
MRIAIIGATGMIGHHTARAAVDRGHELVVVHRASSNLNQLADLKFTSAVADLDDRASLTRALVNVDAVINCAGYYPTAPLPWRDEVKTATMQMDHFYAACAQHKLHKIVYLGAAIALPKNPNGEPGDETLEYVGEPANKNPYLQVKVAMDAQARAKAREGLPVVIGIPSMTLGEYDYGPTTGRLIVELANQRLPGYVRGNRNVIYAGDAGLGLIRVCEDGRAGERYLLTGENHSMDALVQKITRIAGVPMPRPIPLGGALFVSRLQALRYRWLKGPLPKVDATGIAVMSAGQFLSGAKAQIELGFNASVTTDEAVERALHWFRAQGYVSGAR